MNAQDGFKKAPPTTKCLSVRELVTMHGDCWRLYAGKEYVRDSDLVTFDGLEKVSMWLMERGTSPRIWDTWNADDREPVHVDFIYPPIPERCCDYAAYRDPEGLVGRGATPFLAINDLIEQESEAIRARKLGAKS